MRAEKVLHIDLYAASDQPIFREKLLVVTLEAAHSEGSLKDPGLISKWLNNDSNNPCLEHSWLIKIKIELSRPLDEPCCNQQKVSLCIPGLCLQKLDVRR
jgi:hypothetical protein